MGGPFLSIGLVISFGFMPNSEHFSAFRFLQSRFVVDGGTPNSREPNLLG